MHGFGIARRIEQTSRGVFKVNPGSLLIAFQRLERDGLVDAAWQQTDSGRRAKVYSLTRDGRKRLEDETAQWARRAAAVSSPALAPEEALGSAADRLSAEFGFAGDVRAAV